MTHVIVSGEKGGSVMYGADDERGKSTVWQRDGALLLWVSGNLQNTHTYTHIHIRTLTCKQSTLMHMSDDQIF